VLRRRSVVLYWLTDGGRVLLFDLEKDSYDYEAAS